MWTLEFSQEKNLFNDEVVIWPQIRAVRVWQRGGGDASVEGVCFNAPPATFGAAAT